MGQQLENRVRIDTDSFPNLANAVLPQRLWVPAPEPEREELSSIISRQLNVRLFHYLASYSCCAGTEQRPEPVASRFEVLVWSVTLSVAGSTTRTLTVRLYARNHHLRQ